MKLAGFFIEDYSTQHVIRSTDSDIEIIVYRLTPVTRISYADEDLVLFGFGHGTPLAFVASGQQNKINEFVPAVLWYRKYLNKPNMVILKNDPRQPCFDDIL